MSGTESKPDFEMFRATLAKLERLIGIWTRQATDLLGPPSHYPPSHFKTERKFIGEGMIHTLKTLIEFDTNTSESNVFEELEHLVTIENRISGMPSIYYGPSYVGYDASMDPRLTTQGLLQQLIESKIAFLKGGTFSRLISEGGVEPMTALDRLSKIQLKLRSVELSKLLTSKMKEVVYNCEEKASSKISPVIWGQPHSYTAAIDQIRCRFLAQRGGSYSCRSILFCTLNASSLIVHPRLLGSERHPIATYPASAKSKRRLNPCHAHRQGLEIKRTFTCNGF